MWVPLYILNTIKESTLGKGSTQGLVDTILTAEKSYSINVTVTRKKLCLGLHYNGSNSYLFVNGIEITKVKAKDYEINAILLYVGSISKEISADNKKRTGLNGCAFDFSVNKDAIAVDDLLDANKYLMKKNV